MFGILAVLLGAVLALAYLWMRKKFTFWEDRGFVQAPPEIPYGNIKGLGSKKHFYEIFTDLYNNYKNVTTVVGIYFFTSPSLVVTDLELIKNILIKDFNNFHDRGIYVNVDVDPLSGHLFSLEGKAWRDMRAKLTPTFTSGKYYHTCSN